MARVSTEEVLKRWKESGSKPDADDVVLETLIEDTEDHIEFIFPSIWERLDSGELPEQRLNRVVSSVVQRAWMDNGENRSFFSETVGAFSQSATIRSSEDSGIYLTAKEKALLSGQGKRGVLSTVTLYKGRAPYYYDSDCYD